MSENSKKQIVYPGNAALGGILIVLGIVFLLGQMFDIRIGQFVWPFFIIVPGVFLFFLALSLEAPAGEPLSIVGSIVTMVGLLLFYQSITGHWESWTYAWALVAPTSPGLGQILYGTLKGRPETVKTGKDLTKVGLGIFVVAAIFFELIIGVGGFGLGRVGWPLLLIVLGILLLLRNLSLSWRKA